MGSYQILVVDDDLGDRKLLRRLLIGIDLTTQVSEAEDVVAGLGMSDQLFDAIFLDYRLPGMTGLSALAEFRKTWPQAVIFLMTGQGDEGVAKSAILEGASDYLTKATIDEATILKILKRGGDSARLRARSKEQHDDLATFAEVLVHDFRAPIRAAAYLSKQIKEDLGEGDFDEVRHGLTVLEKASSQMMDMLKSLSDHVRFDRDPVFEATSPEALVKMALSILDREISYAGIEIDVQSTVNKEQVLCKPPEVAQVLQNLVANALKFSGGTLPKITVRLSRLGCDEVLFEVCDAGIGIPSHFLKRVFEPFKRVPGTGETKGTGLGLATCKKVIDRHGGRIWCESDGNKGTQMRFTLPLINSNSANSGPARADRDPELNT